MAFALFSILLLNTIVQCGAQDWISVNDQLKGRIIHIETLRSGWRGKWFDMKGARTSWFGEGSHYLVGLLGSSEREVYFKPRTQILVKECDSGSVCLESYQYRDWYVEASKLFAKVGTKYYPNDKTWFQFQIECKNRDLKECRIYSNYYKKYLWARVPFNPDTREEYGINYYTVGVGNYGEGESRFRILAPAPSERYKTIRSITNENQAVTTYNVKFTVGIESSHSTSNSITTSLSTEVGTAFVSASASLSQTWSESKSQTFRKGKEHSMSIPVQPYTRVEVQQLVGSYGPFNVGSKDYKITCQNLRTAKSCINSPTVKRDEEELPERYDEVDDSSQQQFLDFLDILDILKTIS